MTRLGALREEYIKISSIVKGYFEIDEPTLLKSNKEDAVDARYILVGILCEKYNDSDISAVCGLSKSVVNKIRNQILMNQRSKYF